MFGPVSVPFHWYETKRDGKHNQHHCHHWRVHDGHQHGHSYQQDGQQQQGAGQRGQAAVKASPTGRTTGHSSTSVTLDVYGHTSDEAARKAAVIFREAAGLK
ncbi:MAG: hypothetical protein LUC35_03450 [Clostridiales bacterium]|nr:hypothetical protein [Clostridiales bacterium]